MNSQETKRLLYMTDLLARMDSTDDPIVLHAAAHDFEAKIALGWPDPRKNNPILWNSEE